MWRAARKPVSPSEKAVVASCSPPKMATFNKLGGVAHTIASSASESARVKFAPKRQSVSRGSAE